MHMLYILGFFSIFEINSLFFDPLLGSRGDVNDCNKEHYETDQENKQIVGHSSAAKITSLLAHLTNHQGLLFLSNFLLLDHKIMILAVPQKCTILFNELTCIPLAFALAAHRMFSLKIDYNKNFPRSERVSFFGTLCFSLIKFVNNFTDFEMVVLAQCFYLFLFCLFQDYLGTIRH